MELTEKTLESREIFRGRIVTLKVDKIELPDGHQSGREVVEHPGGVAVLPLDDQDMVTLVRQYRYPFGKVITELPAGKLDGPEDHRAAALRELSEEVGLEPEERPTWAVSMRPRILHRGCCICTWHGDSSRAPAIPTRESSGADQGAPSISWWSRL